MSNVYIRVSPIHKSPAGRLHLFSWLTLMALIVSLLGWALAPLPAAASAPAAQPGDSFQKGMSYAAYWSGLYGTPGADLSLELLADTGTDWVAVIVTAHQESHTSTTIIRDHESTPTDAEVVAAIQKAHSLGLNVMLKPHVDLFDEISGGYWRGDIGTGFTTEAQWAAWFAAYRDFIEHYAAIAQANGVEQFCVGTELSGTSHRANDWRNVAAGVRVVYSGPIVYAANQGGEEVSVTWWDAVDYIGVDGYYILNTDISEHPTVADLEAAWTTPKQILANLSATYGKKIILTEIGYRSQHGCSCHPWDWWTPSELDQEEQAYAYEAAFRQLYDQPWLTGIYWWMWSTDRFASGPCDDGFSPHQKPAEAVLRAWYGGSPSSSSTSLMLPDPSQALNIYTDGLAAGWQNWSWWTPTLNMASTDPVYDGSQSLQAAVDPWGAVSLWNPGIDQSAYSWLEFRILGSLAEDQHLVLFVETDDGIEQDHVPVDDCRHIEGGTLATDQWKLVRIPLSDLNRSGKHISRITVQNQSSVTASFWIDDLRLIGAQEATARAFLPAINSGH